MALTENVSYLKLLKTNTRRPSSCSLMPAFYPGMSKDRKHKQLGYAQVDTVSIRACAEASKARVAKAR